MVFNSGFDNSLWLILASDKKYRFNIAEFIYNMPSDLYDNICNQLKEYNIDEELVDYDIKCFRKAVIDNNGLNKYYYIEINPCEIRFKLKRWNSTGDKLNEDIELLLYYSNIDELNDDDYNYPCYLGKYKYNSSRFLYSLLTFFGDEREYEVFDNNNMILDISISEDSEMDRKISVKLLPKEYDLIDLKDRSSVGRLVKGRKKR